MQTPMMPCHLIPTWHDWSVNANDIMMMWFTSYMNLVVSCLASMLHAHMHGTHALCKNSASKYPIGLASMQAHSNLAKITATHFQVLHT